MSIPSAPTFRPTEDEWEQPLRYLASIRPLAEPYGICKIIPPKGWEPPSALGLSRLKFPTRKQKVHELHHRDFQQAQLEFYEDYDRFLHSHGKQLCKWKYPQFLGKDIDIFVLHRAVKKRGGYELVTEQKKWREVAKVLQINEKGQTSIAYGMRQLYVRHLLPYEDWKHGIVGGAAAALAAVKAEVAAAGLEDLHDTEIEATSPVQQVWQSQPQQQLLLQPAWPQELAKPMPQMQQQQLREQQQQQQQQQQVATSAPAELVLLSPLPNAETFSTPPLESQLQSGMQSGLKRRRNEEAATTTGDPGMKADVTVSHRGGATSGGSPDTISPETCETSAPSRATKGDGAVIATGAGQLARISPVVTTLGARKRKPRVRYGEEDEPPGSASSGAPRRGQVGAAARRFVEPDVAEERKRPRQQDVCQVRSQFRFQQQQQQQQQELLQQSQPQQQQQRLQPKKRQDLLSAAAVEDMRTAAQVKSEEADMAEAAEILEAMMGMRSDRVVLPRGLSMVPKPESRGQQQQQQLMGQQQLWPEQQQIGQQEHGQLQGQQRDRSMKRRRLPPGPCSGPGVPGVGGATSPPNPPEAAATGARPKQRLLQQQYLAKAPLAMAAAAVSGGGNGNKDGAARARPSAKAGRGRGGAAGVAPAAAGALGPSSGNDLSTLVCELCRGGHLEDQILLCDHCDRGFHLFCLKPPLSAVPEGEWLCPQCSSGRQLDADGGAALPGGDMAFHDFERQAQNFKRNFWGGEAKAKKASWEEIEFEFWRLVEEGEEQVEVMIATNLDSTVYGSGFPRQDGVSPSLKWNLNHMPRLEGSHPSLLRHVSKPVLGLTAPQLHVGMMFSSTAWHLEDHLLYSINYIHLGDPRRCYAVPNSHRAAFEAAVRDAMPACTGIAPPQLLLPPPSPGSGNNGGGGVTAAVMLSPRALRAAGVPVYGVTQAAGEFMVTWPGAYHASVSLGLQLGEHINLAPPDWLRFAEEAERMQRLSRRRPIFNQLEMLLQTARNECSSYVAGFLVPELHRVIEQEHRLRLALWEQGVLRSRRWMSETAPGPGQAAHAAHAATTTSAANPAPSAGRAADVGKALARGGAKTRSVGGFKARRLARLGAGTAPGGVSRDAASNADEANAPSSAGGSISISSGGGGEVDESDEECAVCRSLLHLSGVECGRCPPGRTVCPHHAGALCGCPVDRRRIVFRNSIKELYELLGDVSRRALAEPRKDLEPGPQPGSSPPVAIGACPASSLPPASASVSAGEQQQLQPRGSCGAVTAAVGPVPKVEPSVPLPGSEALGPASTSSSSGGAGVPCCGMPFGHQQQLHQHEIELQRKLAPTTAYGAGQVVEPGLQGIVAELAARHAAAARAWCRSTLALLGSSGGRAGAVDDALIGMEQFTWGDRGVDEAREVESQCRRAKDWIARTAAFARGRPSLQQLEEALAWDPPPVALPILPRLREIQAVAQDWLERCAAALGTQSSATIPSDGSRAASPSASGFGAGNGGGRNGVKEEREEQRLVTLTALLELEAEGAQLPVDLSELTSLRERIAAVQDLAATAEELLGPGGAPAAAAASADASGTSPRARANGAGRDSPSVQYENLPTLSQLRQLQQQANALRVVLPEVAGLAGLVERAEAASAAAKDCLRTRSTLERLRGFVDMAERLPVYLPELRQVRELLDRATDWLQKVAAARSAGQQTPLKEMRLLLHAGERMGVEMPEAEALRQAIRRREWEDSARRILSSSSTAAKTGLNALAESVDDAARMGAQGSELYTQLRAKLEAAIAWDRRVQQLLAMGACLPGEAEEVEEEQGHQSQSQQQPEEEGGSQGGQGKGDEAVGSGAVAAEILEGREAQTRDDVHPIGRLSTRRRKARKGGDGGSGGGPGGIAVAGTGSGNVASANGSAGGGAGGCGANSGAVDAVPPRSLEDLEILVSEGSRLGLRLERLPVVQKLLEGANKWVQTAGRLLEDAAHGEAPSVAQLEAILAEAAALGFAAAALPLNIVARLKRLLNGVAMWHERVRALLSLPPAETEAGLGSGRAEAEAEELLEVFHSGIGGLDIGEARRLKCWLEGLRWNKQVRTTFAAVLLKHQDGTDNAKGGVRVADTETGAGGQHSSTQKGALKAARAALDRAAALHLPVDPVLRQALSDAVVETTAFEMRVRALLSAARVPEEEKSPASTSVMLRENQVAVWQAAVAALPLLPEVAATLEAVVLDHQSRKTQLEDALSRRTARPSAEQLTAIHAAARAGPLELDPALTVATMKALEEAEAFRERLRKVLPRRNSSLKLDKVLSAMASSVALALEGLRRQQALMAASGVEMTTAERRAVGAFGTHPAGGIGFEDNGDLSGVCGGNTASRWGEAGSGDAGAGSNEVADADGFVGRESYVRAAGKTAGGKVNASQASGYTEDRGSQAFGTSRQRPRGAAGNPTSSSSGARNRLGAEGVIAVPTEEDTAAGGGGAERAGRAASSSGRGAAGASGDSVLVGPAAPPGSAFWLLQPQQLPAEALVGNSQGPPREPVLICLCQSSAGTEDMLLQCGECGDMYHHKCLGMSVMGARAAKAKWTCPICSALVGKDDMDAIEPLCGRFRKTKRPELEELEELLEEAAALKVEVPEEEMMHRTKDMYKTWELLVRDLLTCYEAQLEALRAGLSEVARTTNKDNNHVGHDIMATTTTTCSGGGGDHDGGSGGGDGGGGGEGEWEGGGCFPQKRDFSYVGLAASSRAVREAIKQACVSEVDAVELAAEALRQLRLGWWWSRAAAVLQPLAGSKANLEAVVRLTRGAEPAGVPLDDPVLMELEALHVAGRTWLDAAQDKIGALRKVAGRQVVGSELQSLLQEARELVKKGQALPVKMERELDKLAELSTLYCLCRRLYDENEPMVACDHCDDWYHFRCVGLPRAEDDVQPGTRGAREFRCPRCCVKECIPYMYEGVMPVQMRDILVWIRANRGNGAGGELPEPPLMLTAAGTGPFPSPTTTVPEEPARSRALNRTQSASARNYGSLALMARQRDQMLQRQQQAAAASAAAATAAAAAAAQAQAHLHAAASSLGSLGSLSPLLPAAGSGTFFGGRGGLAGLTPGGLAGGSGIIFGTVGGFPAAAVAVAGADGGLAGGLDPSLLERWARLEQIERQAREDQSRISSLQQPTPGLATAAGIDMSDLGANGVGGEGLVASGPSNGLWGGLSAQQHQQLAAMMLSSHMGVGTGGGAGGYGTAAQAAMLAAGLQQSSMTAAQLQLLASQGVQQMQWQLEDDLVGLQGSERVERF
ncbi:hypothetical protein VaNZ11_000628 [Volvox africanus]|uniref:Uncharacterized protein n=1 Tax=Volvox africanus TaxID=51714 RepID=A0ABQ5RMS0_9CHLO|nr:hypothetical protein VaNZ11_000628 [Volvox africanus]